MAFTPAEIELSKRMFKRTATGKWSEAQGMDLWRFAFAWDETEQREFLNTYHTKELNRANRQVDVNQTQLDAAEQDRDEIISEAPEPGAAPIP
jgi:hypothetical protein